MDQEKFSHDFPHELIKGKIAELIFEMMFREAGEFTPLRFGYEYTLPELAQHSNQLQVKNVLKNISNSPDFVLISKKENKAGKVDVFTVEVKYRSHFDKDQVKKIAQKTNETWNPSWLFVATPEGFFFESCSDVIAANGEMRLLADSWVAPNLKAKYLELLRDFELGHYNGK